MSFDAEIILTGDLILDEPDPDHWLSGIAPRLRSAALVIGHLEVPHTLRGREADGDIPAPGADPTHLAALLRAGFDALTLAGNHIADRGGVGIADTIGELDRLGLSHVGAGADLAEARKPAFLAAGGRCVALLSYNCVGPESSWAAADRPGCAYVKVETSDGGPIWPGASLSRPARESLALMVEDIVDARRQADLVIVALHKGIVHTPVTIVAYERAVAHAAIAAGADVVVGHHAHILRGVEFHLGKPIYHGLGNGCVVTRALSPDQNHPARAAWAHRRRELFGFEPDPAYTLAPFHPEAVHAMLACVRIGSDQRIASGFVPALVEPPGRPVLATGASATIVSDYVSRISRDAGLPPLPMRASKDMVTFI